ncbi:basement membrane-specific heparan sulfate proteoglycan core protein-like isoform X2 [Brachyhypopomus gauderio]|uniref:basement membrane-specific heparan sulfate proteoglycan core protein-like isoform X2 n=1 Tax=Brachyhypopomus gauderio TaxID=698409 RepID=UPI00404118A4
MMCRARMYYRLLVLVICNVQAQERPTAVASIDPDTQVFVGETVTLTCDIEGGGDYQWWFSWYEEGSYRHVYSGQVYTISLVAEHHAGKYTCRGTFAGGSRYSHTSDAVTLTVSDKPKPTVRVSPQSSVYTGDTVTLSCEVQPSVGWKFLWYRNNTPFTKWTSVHGHTNTISEKMSTVGSFMYDCSATRGNYDTHYSNQVKITVTERPTAVVSIDPDSQVFDGETVTLTCDIKGGGATRWQYSWMKDSSVSPVSSAQVFTISDVTESHSDTYTCTVTKTTGSRYSHTSAAVTLTVSDKPRPTVSVSPQSSVYTGDTVTLSCEVQPSVRWRFLWYNYNAPLTKMTSVGDQTKTIIKTMSTVGSFIYKCRAERGNYYTHYSNQATITVTERPTAVVSIDPDQQVFVGETVTLTCDIKGGGDTKWQYSWMKEGSYRHVHNDQVYRISDVRKPHTGQYTCRGTEAGGSRNSLNSDAVTLTVSARPKAMASIDPDPQVFVGETVTLTCDIKGGGDTRWQYSWMKEESNRHVHSGQVYKISDVPKTNTGKYTCRGTFAGGSRYSHTSYAVTLTVSVKPKPELTSSLQGAALIGNPVTLYCKLEQSAGWRFYWSKHTQNPENETSTETSSTTISSVTPSDGGQYWCRAGRGNPVYYTHYSDALWVNVTVHPKAVVILIPDEQVFRGENVTLRCNIQGGDYNWTYRWFKDGSNLFSWDTSQTFNIRSVTEAYGGKYTCRGERSDSQSSDTSDARTLTVSKKPQAVLSMFPQSWLAEGDPVTLSCESRERRTSLSDALQQPTDTVGHWCVFYSVSDHQSQQKSTLQWSLSLTEL